MVREEDAWTIAKQQHGKLVDIEQSYRRLNTGCQNIPLTGQCYRQIDA